ncbi:MAG: DUF3073 domain-containing protein [Dermatophilaceae bacterium]
MGRGRSKAKQTKVARALKYFSPDTDLTALERELHVEQTRDDRGAPYLDQGDDEDNDFTSWDHSRR